MIEILMEFHLEFSTEFLPQYTVIKPDKISFYPGAANLISRFKWSPRRDSHTCDTIYLADTLLIDEISTQSPSYPSVGRPLYIDPFTNEWGQIVRTRKSIFALAARTPLFRDERSEYAIVQREDNVRELRQRLARVTNSLRHCRK